MEIMFTKMKTRITTLFSAIVFLGALSTPLRAQIDEPQGEPTNASAAKGKHRPVAQQEDGVRIDDTGVHVGGPDGGVDIKMPNWGPVLGPLLPVISVLAVFGSPVIILALFFYFRHRRNRMLHETLRTMVEKGVPIPPELLAGGGAALANSFNAARRGSSDLRNGLILIGLGLGVMLLGSNAGFSKLGLIPLLIGVAMIVAWLIGNRMRNKQSPP